MLYTDTNSCISVSNNCIDGSHYINGSKYTIRIPKKNECPSCLSNIKGEKWNQCPKCGANIRKSWVDPKYIDFINTSDVWIAGTGERRSFVTLDGTEDGYISEEM